MEATATKTKTRKLIDMTQGSPTRLLLKFALPLLLGNLFQQVYNLVDSVVVGRFVGANALAAVGACGSFNFLCFALPAGLAVGIGVIISQNYGAGNLEQVKKVIANAVYILAAAAVLFGGLGVLFSRQLLLLLSTPPEILEQATVYLRITCAGIVAVAAYNGISSILQALGDSRTPLYFLILASLVNVALDLLFVVGFGMGVMGVAIATIIAQTVSAVGCILYAKARVPLLAIRRDEMKFEPEIAKNAFRIGIPIAVQNSLIAISCIVLQGVVNSFGGSVIAAFTVTSRVEQLIGQPYSSLAAAVTTYTGQNIGAGKIDRVRKGFRSSVLMALGFSLCMLPLAYLFGESVIRFFVEDPEVIRIGAAALRITSICYFPLGLIYMPRALMNGAGDARFAMLNGMTEVACRIVYSNVFTRIAAIGYWGIWITTGATWVTTCIVCILRYRSGIWQTKALVSNLGESEKDKGDERAKRPAA